MLETAYPKSAVDQVVDYALDLHNFHEASHTVHLFPFFSMSEASANSNAIGIDNGISSYILCCESSLAGEILNIVHNYDNGTAVD